MLLGVDIDLHTTCTQRGWVGNIMGHSLKQCSTHKHLRRVGAMYSMAAAECIWTPGATEIIPYWDVRDTPLQLTRARGVPNPY